jgi:ABC-type transport system involved in cytochrome bd biosynthesis fused ATPase/permease subunit
MLNIDITKRYADQFHARVERIIHYQTLEQEPPAKLDDDPPQEWPKHGGINFRNVALRYRDGLPLVLDGLTFDVKPGERVGIIGRTGAGKALAQHKVLIDLTIHNQANHHCLPRYSVLPHSLVVPLRLTA